MPVIPMKALVPGANPGVAAKREELNMRALLLVSLVPLTICAQDLAGQRVRSPLPQLRPELRVATLSAREHLIDVSAPSCTSPQSRDYRRAGLPVAGVSLSV